MLETPLRRIVAWLALSAFIATQSMAMLETRHGGFADDTACLSPNERVTGADHQNGPQIEDIRPPRPLEHCPFCHLLRTLNNARPDSVGASVLPPAPPVFIAEPAAAPAAGIKPGSSPRGPPSQLA